MSINNASSPGEPTNACYYCGLDKPQGDFSDEHIWPDALGGDFLPKFWRTNNVCARCNSLSGVFVDGAFIRGWAGNSERFRDSQCYLVPNAPSQSVVPLAYLGKLLDPNVAITEVADWWAGPCGATIVHLRPKEDEELWAAYHGGDPRAKRARAGRAYIALASENQFWVDVALASFQKHFKRSKRYAVNVAFESGLSGISEIDRSDPAQVADLLIFDAITEAAKAGRSVPARQVLQLDAGHRLMCKLGLAIGCQLFGVSFGLHRDGDHLRRAFRECDLARRQSIPIRGTGYFNSSAASPLSILGWPGGWVLMLQVINNVLSLTIVTPSKKQMCIVITDDPKILAKLPPDYAAGLVWVTVPPLGKAAGPFHFPDYIAHLTKSIPNAELTAFEAARIDPAILPSC
jgi:hypothetical protein